MRRFISGKMQQTYLSKINGRILRRGQDTSIGRRPFRMNQGVDFMSFRMLKLVWIPVLMGFSGEALALEPCHHGVPGITIIGGPYSKLPEKIAKLYGDRIKEDPLVIIEGSSVMVPPSISPDTESTNPNGSLKEQGWHNLKKAQRPLSIVCRYADKAVPVALPDSVDTCIFTPGHVICQ